MSEKPAKMDPAIKQRWLKALRGEYKTRIYKQGTGYLNPSDGKYCCLGVLCDLVDPKGWGDPDVDNEDERPFKFRKESASKLAPDTVLTKTGLSETVQGHLAGLNDEGKKFSTIANWIEKHL